ncbi:flagellar basal body P-ring formation chaperone FlgA [Gallaecimonas mangrovi]|uniref:flagellar basal body P-ring formation chaperone FlgA n=1 Tax=Gallaecimonas mangrovi TaxID=2291597 RepID=UPI000E202556|nr:flagellar basal body P-ring formation chaperone FlgA [Gallaecimonas mangrovi]
MRKFLLPPGKLLLPLLFCHSVWATDFLPTLKKDATAHLVQFAKQAHWPKYQAKISPWLPQGAEQLPVCKAGLSIGPARHDLNPWGRIPYTLSCQSPKWTFRARVDVDLMLPVYHVHHAIAAGSDITSADIKREKTHIADVHSGFLTHSRDIVGFRARRNLRPGQVINAAMLAQPLLVKKGEQVVIRAESQGVSASTKGVAMQDGSQGDGIAVRNLSSGKVVTGWVVAPGVVKTRF